MQRKRVFGDPSLLLRGFVLDYFVHTKPRSNKGSLWRRIFLHFRWRKGFHAGPKAVEDQRREDAKEREGIVLARRAD